MVKEGVSGKVMFERRPKRGKGTSHGHLEERGTIRAEGRANEKGSSHEHDRLVLGQQAGQPGQGRAGREGKEVWGDWMCLTSHGEDQEPLGVLNRRVTCFSRIPLSSLLRTDWGTGNKRGPGGGIRVKCEMPTRH